MSNVLFDNVKKASLLSDSVIVFFSGGKDSVVTLDLCLKYFDHVEVFFMYLVRGLSFNESLLNWYEKKYNIQIHRIPHFMLSEWLKYGSFRQPDFEVPICSPKDIYNYARSKTGIYWIAAGERIKDSIVRRAMIKQSGEIDNKRGRFYPVAQWSKSEILAYIKKKRLKISPEYRVLGFSFRSLMPEDLVKIKEHYPNDYKKIESQFPFVETNIKQYEFFRSQQVSEV